MARLTAWWPVPSNFNVLIVGEQGSGRTTLLRQVARELRERRVQAQWIDAATALTTPALVELVTARLLNGTGQAAGDGWALQWLLSAPPDELPRVFRRRPSPVAAVSYGLFGTLRDELWQLPVRWVVTCTDRDRGTLPPPADAFFDVVVSLPPLQEKEARALVRARVPDGQLSTDAMTTIMDVGGGNPGRWSAQPALLTVRAVRSPDAAGRIAATSMAAACRRSRPRRRNCSPTSRRPARRVPPTPGCSLDTTGPDHGRRNCSVNCSRPGWSRRPRFDMGPGGHGRSTRRLPCDRDCWRHPLTAARLATTYSTRHPVTRSCSASMSRSTN